jgi:uncharacterized circularly permuted ATP-grasp superfamily protein/uncharacterized alpha-E superfamily protein
MNTNQHVACELPQWFGNPFPPDGTYNEMRMPNGELRDHWGTFVDGVASLGLGELENRWNIIKRILRNHGVTYHLSTGDGNDRRPWELDLLPHLISQEEWAIIENGVIQRARLHNLILQDIYTNPQHLLRNGEIPPALVYANPNFLRSCRGVSVPQGRHLQLHAIDLARSTTGQWWVLDDRMQTPNGLGYALENRSIIGRVHQDLFSNLGVGGFRRFFELLRQNLIDLNPNLDRYPRVVLLTPGSLSSAHYDHSLLARYLGYTLAEGGDLTVRKNEVFLKTVEGPQKVDVILRRVNDTLCDPLELDQDSSIGIPGLVQAARMGNVAIANSLGSAVVETPALLPTLAQLSSRLLGENLILPNVETWWCGDVSHCRHVLAHLDQLIIKRTFTTHKRSTFSGMELTSREIDQLRLNIQQRPHEYVAQPPVNLSRAPLWNGHQMEDRPIVLRVFVIATRHSYAVLPGGLTKVSTSEHTPVKGLQLSGASKDTWVINRRSIDAGLPAIILETRPASRMETGVPSRTADNFFWMGRYAERLEQLALNLNAILSRLVESDEPRREHQALQLAGMLGQLGISPYKSISTYEFSSLMIASKQVFFEPRCEGGVADLCQKVFTTAISLRDRFSNQTWRVLNQLNEFPDEKSSKLYSGELLSANHELLTLLSAFSGIQNENVIRGHEWRFLDFGKRLERSQHLCSLLRHVISIPGEIELLLNPLLEICDSSMTYRREHYSEPEVASVLKMLLMDSSNPRALKFNLNLLERHVSKLPNEPQSEHAISEKVKTLQELVSQSWSERLVESAVKGDVSKFGETMDYVDRLFLVLSDALTQQYFSLVRPKANSHEFC